MAKIKKTAKTAASTPTPAEAPEGEGYVAYCKLPNGYSFILPNGRKLTLNGSNHKNPDGQALTVVGYGRTRVRVEDWDYVMAVYGGMKIFSEDNPLIFAAENNADGDAAAREYGPSTTHGMEQRDRAEIIRTAQKQAGNPQPKDE